MGKLLFSRGAQAERPAWWSLGFIILDFSRKCNGGSKFSGRGAVGFTMMCDTGAGAVEMWKTAVRFPHIPTALLRCLRRFSGLREKKVANRDGLC